MRNNKTKSGAADAQKLEERGILKSFKEFNSLDFSILNIQQAKKIFDSYTGEEPDFIIKISDNYIGIELFRLSVDQKKVAFDWSATSQNKKYKRNYKNNYEKLSLNPNRIETPEDFEKYLGKTKELKNDYGISPLFQQDDILTVLEEQIAKKIHKLPNYKTSKVWL